MLHTDVSFLGLSHGVNVIDSRYPNTRVLTDEEHILSLEHTNRRAVFDHKVREKVCDAVISITEFIRL